jgi:hypothetical protein
VYRLVTGDTVDEDIYEMGEDLFLVLVLLPSYLHPPLHTIIVNSSSIVCDMCYLLPVYRMIITISFLR